MNDHSNATKNRAARRLHVTKNWPDTRESTPVWGLSLAPSVRNDSADGIIWKSTAAFINEHLPLTDWTAAREATPATAYINYLTTVAWFSLHPPDRSHPAIRPSLSSDISFLSILFYPILYLFGCNSIDWSCCYILSSFRLAHFVHRLVHRAAWETIAQKIHQRWFKSIGHFVCFLNNNGSTCWHWTVQRWESNATRKRVRPIGQ